MISFDTIGGSTYTLDAGTMTSVTADNRKGHWEHVTPRRAVRIGESFEFTGAFFGHCQRYGSGETMLTSTVTRIIRAS